MKIVDLPIIVKHQVKEVKQKISTFKKNLSFFNFVLETSPLDRVSEIHPSGFCPLKSILPLPKNPFLCQIVIVIGNRDDLGSILNLEDVVPIDSCFNNCIDAVITCSLQTTTYNMMFCLVNTSQERKTRQRLVSILRCHQHFTQHRQHLQTIPRLSGSERPLILSKRIGVINKIQGNMSPLSFYF